MNKRLLKKFFPLIAILLLAPWPVAYAYENTVAGSEIVQIEAAEASVAPGLSVYGGAIGGVTTSSDLFYIDITKNPTDTLVTLHLTNTDELVHYYRYLILKVGVYVQTDINQWEEAAMGNGELIPDTYITMRNGNVSFTLPGYAKYKIAIDGGSFYCFRTDAGEGGLSPKFYVTAE